ncbi:hypothetical protein BaRGS_00036657 [Batillaria attramentaria]|uniref:Uncharacterized protein n=1 Tax=Batillaria attramentaria TaxID=370345 RepID=A0ABD0JB45_9CAEN
MQVRGPTRRLQAIRLPGDKGIGQCRNLSIIAKTDGLLLRGQDFLVLVYIVCVQLLHETVDQCGYCLRSDRVYAGCKNNEGTVAHGL